MKLISLITEGRRASLERRTSDGRRGNGGEGRRNEDGGTGDVCLERRFCIREAAIARKHITYTCTCIHALTYTCTCMHTCVYAC